ncbi:hypothetical protein, partial [Aeromonas veronii]|uniref:hypothetical protein n=1 Tax=Aeromonas veronii TaxID=654 RepID=UPI001F1EA175
HAVISHRFTPLKIIVLATITLPNKPMALTIPPNLHHARGLYPLRAKSCNQPETAPNHGQPKSC